MRRTAALVAKFVARFPELERDLDLDKPAAVRKFELFAAGAHRAQTRPATPGAGSATVPELRAWPARVGEALEGPKASLLETERELVARVTSAVKALPLEARNAILSGDESSPLHQAYLLGQLSFAQLLVSQAAGQRADDDFVDMLRSTTFAPMVQVLQERGEVSNHDLSGHLGESAEGISRKLRVLRDKGATVFRKDGRTVLNFLTPAARQVCEQLSSVLDNAQPNIPQHE